MSRRAAIWGATALSLLFVLLLSAVLLQPALGSGSDSINDGVVTADSLYDPLNYDDEWDDEYDDHDEHEDEDHEDDEDD